MPLLTAWFTLCIRGTAGIRGAIFFNTSDKKFSCVWRLSKLTSGICTDFYCLSAREDVVIIVSNFRIWAKIGSVLADINAICAFLEFITPHSNRAKLYTFCLFIFKIFQYL